MEWDPNLHGHLDFCSAVIGYFIMAQGRGPDIGITRCCSCCSLSDPQGQRETQGRPCCFSASESTSSLSIRLCHALLVLGRLNRARSVSYVQFPSRFCGVGTPSSGNPTYSTSTDLTDSSRPFTIGAVQVYSAVQPALRALN